MRVVPAIVAVSALFASAPAFAVMQAPETQKPPAQTAPPKAPPAPKPAAEAAPAPRPFPAGAKIAFIDIQRIATESIEGKGANSKVQALNQKKVTELNDKNKALQTAQQKLSAGGVMSDDARALVQKDVDRLNLEIQRFTQDAQAEVEEFQRQVQADFQKKLLPIIELVAIDKGLQIVFAADAGFVWADQAVDLTADIIKRFDAAVAGTAQEPSATRSPPLDRRQPR